MSHSVILTLNTPVSVDYGNSFDLTADVGTVSPSSATKTELLSGLVVLVDSLATQVTITPKNSKCSNPIITTIAIQQPQCKCYAIRLNSFTTPSCNITWTDCNGNTQNGIFDPEIRQVYCSQTIPILDGDLISMVTIPNSSCVNNECVVQCNCITIQNPDEFSRDFNYVDCFNVYHYGVSINGESTINVCGTYIQGGTQAVKLIVTTGSPCAISGGSASCI